MKLTFTKPPIEILDLLHDYEKLGGEVPKDIDAWWLQETKMIEEFNAMNTADVVERQTQQT